MKWQCDSWTYSLVLVALVMQQHSATGGSRDIISDKGK